MKKILLIIDNDELRQVYHEILFSHRVEVTPVKEISTAIMLLNLDKFSVVILDMGNNLLETEIFFRLRKNYKNLLKTKFVVLTKDKNFSPNLIKTDLLINCDEIPFEEVIKKIENSCNI